MTYTVDKLRRVRDEENCFRIVELGIPKGHPVTLLASPRYDPNTEKIFFVSPDRYRSEQSKLEGHTKTGKLPIQLPDGVDKNPKKSQAKIPSYDYEANKNLPLTQKVSQELSHKYREITTRGYRPTSISYEDVKVPRFRMRITKGHSIDNLIRHSKLSMLSYAGLAAMGVFTVNHGKKLMRERVVQRHST